MGINEINTLAEAKELILEQRDENAELRRQIDWLKRQLFGAKSEKLKPLDAATPDLFAAAESSSVEPSPATEPVAAHERKMRDKNGWNDMPKDLPREEEVSDVPAAEREGMELIGCDTSERYARRETRYLVKVIKRAKYADLSNAIRDVVTAPAAGDFLDSVSGKTKFDVSFVAGVGSDKIENHQPIYRQAKIMNWEGVPVNCSTLQSLFSGAAKQLEVLYECQNELIDQCEIIHGDETPIRLLDPGKGKCKKAYMWVKMTGLEPPLESFHFANSRKKEVAEALYKDYYGTLIRDNYASYADLKAEHAGCRAHVRRKFFEANEAGFATAGGFWKLSGDLYALEREAEPRSEAKDSEVVLFNERKRVRRASAALVKEFFEMCEAVQSVEIPNSPPAKAVNYAWNQRATLEKFLKDPRLNIDNHPAENVIRPIALGRKNWLFPGNEAGGKHLARPAVFAATCRKSNVNFRRWLEDIPVKPSSTPVAELDWFLPHVMPPIFQGRHYVEADKK